MKEHKKFAKLFDSEKYGQIVIINQTNDDGRPECKIFFSGDGLDVCSFGPEFEESKKGYDSCDNFFEKLSIETVDNCIRDILDYL